MSPAPTVRQLASHVRAHARLADTDTLAAARCRVPAPTWSPLLPRCFPATTGHAPRSSSGLSASSLNVPSDINVFIFDITMVNNSFTSAARILPFKPQVEHNQPSAPAPNHPIEGEVAFCVRGVISPLLANAYLHYSFDLWAERWRRREATGDMIIVRYADDIVVGFEHETDARRFWDAMRVRLQEFSLSLHPEKTRLIEFGRHAANKRKQRGLGKPETFNFLGMTFICGKSRGGKFLLKRRTRRDRMQAKIKEVAGELRRRMHQSIPEQGKWLKQVITGFFNYHAVPTNWAALGALSYRDHRTLALDTQPTQPKRRSHLGSNGEAG